MLISPTSLDILKQLLPSFKLLPNHVLDFPGGSAVKKNPPANTGETRGVGSIPGSGRSPGKGNSNPLQYSHLENPMDRGAWQTTVHRVLKSGTQLKQLSMHKHA